MADTICCQCGDPFERDAAWKVRCLSCWIDNKNTAAFNANPTPRQSRPNHQGSFQQPPPRPQAKARPTPEPRAQTRTPPRPQSPPPQPQPQVNTAQYQKEISKLRQEVETLRMQLLLEKNRNRPAPSTVSTSIPEDMLGRLIRLAHPDRHGNSEASNKATAWLLSQRKAGRR